MSAPPSRRHVAAVLLGNGLEFYDFLAYSFFALQIGRAFFPSQNPLSSLLLALATFGAGFLTRPIGALIIGRYADRVGRRPAMMLTFVLMGISILGVALTPSFQFIGVAAPILVVIWRLLQGFALGGEVGPSTAFLIESAPVTQRALYGSLQNATQGTAVLCAGLVGVALSAILDTGALDLWGWRIAFLIGAAVVPVGVFIRRSLPETLQSPSAIDDVMAGAPGGQSLPLTALLGLGILTSGTVATYVRTYMTTYAVATLGFSAHVAFVTTTVHGLTMAVAAVGGGWLADRIGRKPVMVGSSVLLAATTLPIFMVITHYRVPATLYVGMVLLGTFAGFAMAPMLAAITEALPGRIRAGAVGTLYAVAVCAFGGTTQFMVAWLIGLTGSAMVPGWYSVTATLIGLAAMIAMRETGPRIRQEARGGHGNGGLRSGSDALRWSDASLASMVNLPASPSEVTMREPPEYREFLSRKITCTSCHWSDLGAYARTGEPVKWGIEKFCPQCGEFVAHAPWPTTEEPVGDGKSPGNLSNRA